MTPDHEPWAITFAQAKDAAVTVARDWSSHAFLTLEQQAQRLTSDDGEAYRDHMHQVAGITAADLANEVDLLGRLLDLPASERGRLICETVTGFYDRLDELVCTVQHRGSA